MTSVRSVPVGAHYVTLGDSYTAGPLVPTRPDPRPADEAGRFTVGSTTGYEIDLSAKNAAALSRLLAPYIEHARQAGRAPGRRAGRTASSRQRSGDIRTGAKENGLTVSERGRIPASVVEQYHAAGGGR